MSDHRRRVHRAWLWMLAAVCYVIASACSSPPASRVDPPSAVVVGARIAPAPPPSISASVALPPPPDPSPVSEPEAVKVVPRSDATTFACGSRTCKSREETCCSVDAEGTCLASTPDDGAKGAIGYLKTQWEACGEVQFERSSNFQHIARCDESVDCPDHHVCCQEFLFSGAEGLEECKPLPRDGSVPCDYGEICIDSASCRLPDTVCEGGACVKRVPTFACGDKVCPAGEVCCGGDKGCVDAAECPFKERMKCRSDSHCLRGQRCVFYEGTTRCVKSWWAEGIGVPRLCKKDGECTSSCSNVGGGKESCVETEVPWIKACACP